MIHIRIRLCFSLLAGRLPDLLNGFGQTNVVRLELVVSPSNDEHGKHVGVLESLTPAGHAPFREVVGYYVPSGVHVSMAMVRRPKAEPKGRKQTYWKPV